VRARASLRARAAASAAVAVNWASRRAGLGSGTVAGGRAGLVVDPHLVEKLCVGRPVALVSGTNGKTTTTALLAGALGAGLGGGVVTNATGSNMPAGHAAALAAGGRTGPVVLEVDEAYLPAEVASLEPTCAVLLNLSRDQLDRTSEVRMLANRWRVPSPGSTGRPRGQRGRPSGGVGRRAGRAVHWIGAGLGWRNDAVGCPSCGEQVTFADAFGAGGWSCVCGFARRRSRPGWRRRLTEGRSPASPMVGALSSTLSCPVASIGPTPSWRPWPPVRWGWAPTRRSGQWLRCRAWRGASPWERSPARPLA